LAKTPRKWTGARTPSGLKRVRSSERRHAILQPRRTAAKSLTKKALVVATTTPEGQDPAVALAEALSALDRAAKSGAIHPNAAARRKSRLTRKVNAALGGTTVVTTSRAVKTTGTAAAAKAAKARIAAGKAAKAKGAQTAAGKARAALSKTARTETTAQASPAQASPATEPAAKPARATRTTTKTAAKATASKTAASKTAKATAKGDAEKAAPKATARAPRAKKTEKPAE
jgi:ribosomal protein S20